jgi:hypothetical protein
MSGGKPVITATASKLVVLAGSNDRVIYILVEVANPQPTGNALALPKELRVVADVSGSMASAAAPGASESKLDVVKEGMINVVNGMGELDTLSVVGFDDDKHQYVRTHVVGQNRQKAINAINAIQTGGSTKMSDALKHGVINTVPGTIKRAHLGTDGNVNVGGAAEKRKCIEIMGNPDAVPVWIIGLGEDYDPTFLNQLAAAGKTGTFMMHVSDAYEYANALQTQLALLSSLGSIMNVKISGSSTNGVKIVEAQHLVPDHKAIPFTSDSFSYDHGDLDALGQRILLKVVIPAQDLYHQRGEASYDLLNYDVTYSIPGQGQQAESGMVSVEITADEQKHQQAGMNQVVMTTVYTAQGAMYTNTGDLQKAATMFTLAGNTNVAQSLQTLSSGGMTENDARSLRTQINLSNSGLDTLSS